MGYDSEAAFRTALNTRLSTAARESRFTRDEVARAFALQVFLARLFRSDAAPHWMLTGGTALQYRAPDEARPTADADLAARLELHELQADLNQAADPAAGEFGRFQVTVRSTRTPGAYTTNLQYLVGGKRLAAAKLDIVTYRTALFPAEELTPAPVVVIDGGIGPVPPIRVNSAAEAVADKVAAMYERHGPTGTTASTRSHDLVDLVILSRAESFDSHRVRAAVAREEQRRSVTIPRPLTLPNPTWVTTYPRDAARSGLPVDLHDVHRALAAANAFLEPALTGQADRARWDAPTGQWRTPEAPI